MQRGVVLNGTASRRCISAPKQEEKKMAVVIGFMWLLAMTSPSLSQTEYERQQQKLQKMLPELDRLLVTSAVMIKI
jgi:hypothetical protein